MLTDFYIFPLLESKLNFQQNPRKSSHLT